jgi:fructose-1,6-bisphosphatase
MDFFSSINVLFYKAIGEFVLTDVDIKVPKRGNIISINEAYTYMWDEPIKEYVNSKKDPKVRDVLF